MAGRNRLSQVQGHLSNFTSESIRAGLYNGWTNGFTDWSNMAGGPAGERLIPHIIEDYAEITPKRVWVSVAHSSDLSEGFFDITFKELAHCVNYVAWLLDATIGRSNDFETIAYMGNPDFRYLILVVAAMKCGFTVSTLLRRLLHDIEPYCLDNIAFSQEFCSRKL